MGCSKRRCTGGSSCHALHGDMPGAIAAAAGVQVGDVVMAKWGKRSLKATVQQIDTTQLRPFLVLFECDSTMGWVSRVQAIQAVRSSSNKKKEKHNKRAAGDVVMAKWGKRMLKATVQAVDLQSGGYDVLFECDNKLAWVKHVEPLPQQAADACSALPFAKCKRQKLK